MTYEKKIPTSVVQVLPGGRVTIPKHLQRLLGINRGDRMAVYVDPDAKAITYVLGPRLKSSKILEEIK